MSAAIERAELAGPFIAAVPTASQREAIEAEPGPMLVLAGPGAGKTFCLAERIRFLIEQRDFDPSRICAFTFTNKAAGEISVRLARHLGERASRVKGGTIHAFCAELLREFGSHVSLRAGFGIADEDYQLAALRRIGAPSRWNKSLLKRFSAHHFRNESLDSRDIEWLEKYERFLDKRNMVDYDTLVLKAADLLSLVPDVADIVRSRYDYVLVDEFQDLNPKQYAIVHQLAATHRNVFAVGDDQQSIYSWAGADPRVFLEFMADFNVAIPVSLQENRRCPKQVFELALRLVDVNPSLFSTGRSYAPIERETQFPVAALSFENENDEMSWVVDDLRRDHAENGLEWGDIALLYRTNRIGDGAEAAFLNAGIPVRLARGRALGEDPVVAYVIAALRVIANPADPLHKENFLGAVLPRTLIDAARAKAEENQERVVVQLDHMGRSLPRENSDGKKIRRGFSALRNLAALGSRYTNITPLVNELLSHRVGEYRTVLDEHYDELSDPASNPEVTALATQLRAARAGNRLVRIVRLGGVEIAMKAILLGIGFKRVQLGGPPMPDALTITGDETMSLGAMLGLFKAAQLLSSDGFANVFRDFTAIDLETTGRSIASAEIIEVAAVRVREGRIVDEFHRLIKPRVPIEFGATATHGISEADVADAPFFETVWPVLRAFCGRDVLVAHNGNQFDFPIIRRMARELSLDGGTDLNTYDTLPLARDLRPGSAKLVDLAREFGVDAGQSHRALDDTRALALVFLALSDVKMRRARITALSSFLDYLGIGLALSNPEVLGDEAKQLRRLTVGNALGRYTDCLDVYRDEREKGDDHSLPTVGDVIGLLGGEEVMLRVRTEKGAEQRYPAAMTRMRGLLENCQTGTLPEQIGAFLEKASLSSRPGETEPAKARVNLLTLHATKGLEFSRVYVLGAEDGQLIGGTANRAASRQEVEEARRLLYVGMTRTKERLVLTRVVRRDGEPTGGHQFLDEMGLRPTGA